MSLSPDDVKRIARLARIEIDDAQAQATQGQLNTIFDLIATMQAVDTRGIAPMAHAQEVYSAPARRRRNRNRPPRCLPGRRARRRKRSVPRPQSHRISHHVRRKPFRARCAAGRQADFQPRARPAVSRPHRRLESVDQCLHHGGRRQDAGRGRRRRRAHRRGQGRPADRRTDRAQGYFLHRRLAHHLRLEDAAQLCRAL